MFPAFMLILMTLLREWLVPAPPVEVTPICGYERILPVPTGEPAAGYPASTAPVHSCGDHTTQVHLATRPTTTPVVEPLV